MMLASHVLNIQDMKNISTCGNDIQETCRSVLHVRFAHVDHETKRVFLVCTFNVMQACRTAIHALGYSTTYEKEDMHEACHLQVLEMMCMKNCGKTVKTALRSLQQVQHVVIELETKSVYVYCKKQDDNEVEIVDMLDMVGFDASLRTEEEDNDIRNGMFSIPMPLESSNDPGTEMQTLMESVNDVKCYCAIFIVGGMSCAACVKSIEKVVNGLDGVLRVRVQLIAQKAEVDFDPTLVSETKISKIICDAGYQAEYLRTISPEDNTVQIKLLVEEMKDASTAASIEKTVKEIDGFDRVDLNVAFSSIIIHLKQGTLSGPRTCIEKINAAGYAAELARDDTAGSFEAPIRAEIAKWRSLLFRSLLFAAPAMVVHHLLTKIDPFATWLDITLHNRLTIQYLVMWLLATPIQFGIDGRFL